MNDLLKSSSVNPMALYIALCGDLAVPSTTFLLDIFIFYIFNMVNCNLNSKIIHFNYNTSSKNPATSNIPVTLLKTNVELMIGSNLSSFS